MGFFYSKKKPLSVLIELQSIGLIQFSIYIHQIIHLGCKTTRGHRHFCTKSGTRAVRSHFFIGIKQDCSYIHIDVIYENLPSLFFFLHEKIQALQWIQITLYRLVKIRKRGFLLFFFLRILADFIHDFQLLTKSYRVPAYFVCAVHKIVKYPV